MAKPENVSARSRYGNRVANLADGLLRFYGKSEITLPLLGGRELQIVRRLFPPRTNTNDPFIDYDTTVRLRDGGDLVAALRRKVADDLIRVKSFPRVQEDDSTGPLELRRPAKTDIFDVLHDAVREAISQCN